MKKFIQTTALVLGMMATGITASFADKNEDYQKTYNYQRGIELVNKEEYDEALTYFEKEISDHKDNGYAMAWMASIQYRQDNNGKAIETLSKAMKCLNKKDDMYAFCLRLRSQVYTELEEKEKALADLNMQVKMFPKSVDSYEDRASWYLNEDRFEEANQDFMKMIQLESGNAKAYVGSGICLRSLKRYDESIEQYNYAVKLEPHYGQAYAQRAYSYMLMKRYPEAAEGIVKALDEDSNDLAFNMLNQMADSAFEDMDFKLKLQQMMEPNNHYWLYMRGHVMQRAKKYASAIEMYEASNKLKYLTVTKRRIAESQKAMGDYETALSTINDALAIDSTDWYLWHEKVNILMEASTLEEALKAANRVVELDPRDVRSYADRAYVKKYMKNVNGTIEDLSMALMLNPNAYPLQAQRGELYLNQGQEQLAKKDFEEVLKRDTIPAEYSVAFYVHYYLGEEEKALAALDSAMSHNSKEQAYNAACLYSLMNRPDDALKYLEMALKDDFKEFKHIEYDTDLDNIRQLPAFKELIEKYKKLLEEKLGKKLTSQEDEPSDDDYETIVKEIPFVHEGGVTKVRCTINDLPLHFVFDTGASEVTISTVEATFMLKNGYLGERDITGTQKYMTADGNITEGTTIILRNVNFGGLELTDVKASVVKSQKAPLLLGQSVFQRLGKIEIDNSKNVIKVTQKVKK